MSTPHICASGCSQLRSKGLWTALFVAYGGPYAFAAFLKLIQDCLAFLQPQLLRLLLAYISEYQSARASGGERPSEFEGFAIAVVMFTASIVQTIILHQVCSVFFSVYADTHCRLVLPTMLRNWHAHPRGPRRRNLPEGARALQ